MGNDSDGSRPRWPGAPGPGGSNPPGAQPYVPVVRTVPLRAVTPYLGPMHPPQGPMQSPQPPTQPPQAPAPKKAGGHDLAGTVVMHAEPIHLPPPPPAPPPPAAPPQRPAIQEAPFIEVPTRVAMMSDWPTGHPVNDILRNRPPATRRDRRGRRTLVLACGVALGIGAIAAGIFFALRFSVGAGLLGKSKGSPAASVAVESEPSVSDASTTDPTPEASSSAAPSSSTAQTSATPGASSDALIDVSKLLSYEAYLTVSSSVDAEVFVQGVLAGRTNARLLVRCGTRNVRLRKDGGTWLTKGEAMKVPCMKAATVNVEPQ